MMETIILYGLQALGLLVVATIVFDVVHFVLHLFIESRAPLLNKIGALHQTHHDFFNRDLVFVEALSWRNWVEHIVPEFMTRIVVALIGLFFVSPWAVAMVLGLQLMQLVVVTWGRGRDSNHIDYQRLLPPRSGFFVGPRYHALHHIYPLHYYASFVTFFDKLLGTACPLEGKKVALTGASGALGAPLQKILEAEGARVTPLKFGVDYTYDDYSSLDPVLAEADIVVLAHGSKLEHAMEANCDSFVAIIERFKQLSAHRRFPVEVWAVGSEIEFHPAWGNKELGIYLESKRAFAKHAYRYFHEAPFIYRHICPAGFTSRMGPGLISGATAARWAMFFIRRGFTYVPVTYTGFAVLNYFKFLLRWRREKDARHQLRVDSAQDAVTRSGGGFRY
ncbi:MAG: sterol desaturase family protein [Myxococcaceae bacterium]|nr:sterol desaturase family protein [Myxococcaceae bacterium]